MDKDIAQSRCQQDSPKSTLPMFKTQEDMNAIMNSLGESTFGGILHTLVGTNTNNYNHVYCALNKEKIQNTYQTQVARKL